MDLNGGIGGEPWYGPNKVESLKTLGLISVYVSDDLWMVKMM